MANRSERKRAAGFPRPEMSFRETTLRGLLVVTTPASRGPRYDTDAGAGSEPSISQPTPGVDQHICRATAVRFAVYAGQQVCGKKTYETTI